MLRGVPTLVVKNKPLSFHPEPATKLLRVAALAVGPEGLQLVPAQGYAPVAALRLRVVFLDAQPVLLAPDQRLLHPQESLIEVHVMLTQAQQFPFPEAPPHSEQV